MKSLYKSPFLKVIPFLLLASFAGAQTEVDALDKHYFFTEWKNSNSYQQQTKQLGMKTFLQMQSDRNGADPMHSTAYYSILELVRDANKTVANERQVEFLGQILSSYGDARQTSRRLGPTQTSFLLGMTALLGSKSPARSDAAAAFLSKIQPGNPQSLNSALYGNLSSPVGTNYSIMNNYFNAWGPAITKTTTMAELERLQLALDVALPTAASGNESSQVDKIIRTINELSEKDFNVAKNILGDLRKDSKLGRNDLSLSEFESRLLVYKETGSYKADYTLAEYTREIVEKSSMTAEQKTSVELVLENQNNVAKYEVLKIILKNPTVLQPLVRTSEKKPFAEAMTWFSMGTQAEESLKLAHLKDVVERMSAEKLSLYDHMWLIRFISGADNNLQRSGMYEDLIKIISEDKSLTVRDITKIYHSLEVSTHGYSYGNWHGNWRQLTSGLRQDIALKLVAGVKRSDYYKGKEKYPRLSYDVLKQIPGSFQDAAKMVSARSCQNVMTGW